MNMGGKDAVIVGYDAISPLGNDLEKQWQQALQGKSGIGPLTRFQLPDKFPVHIAGQVPDIDHEDYPFLSARHQAAWSSPVFKYSMLSVARALKRSGIEISPDIALRTAVTYSSAIGGLDAVLNADQAIAGGEQAAPALCQSQLLYQHGRWQDSHSDRSTGDRLPPPSPPVPPV